MQIKQAWPGVIEEVVSTKVRGPIFSTLVGEGGGRPLVDLGAGPCWFARRARNAGWQVTAVDARTERLPEDMEEITFIESDVRSFDVSSFHTVVVLGLLYHLTLTEQADLLAGCAGKRVILETQVHTEGIVPPAAEPWGHQIVEAPEMPVFRGAVSPENENPMASIGNPTSFWPDEEGLLTIFERSGFQSVQVIEPAHLSKYGTRKFYVLNSELVDKR